MTAEVTIDHITHRFGDFVALRDVDLKIDEGSFAVLLGPSGCGKTTLLSMIGGFLTPSEGRVLIGGADVTHLPPAKRPTTTMFQDYALFPHMTLGANVGFGLRMRGIARAGRDKSAAEMLALVGLPDAAEKKPHELSGGQRQRVALARALAVNPDVLLLDEPLGALDLKLRKQMQDELKDIQRRVGTTFIHVTHDQEEAMAIADQVIVMNEGTVQHSGSPESVYLRPRNRFTAAFMGETNFLSGQIVERNNDSIVVASALGQHTLPAHVCGGDVVESDAHVELCFRPEHFASGEVKPNRIDLGTGVIKDIAFFGSHHRCHVAPEALADDAFVMHLPQSSSLDVGDQVPLRLDPNDVVVFSKNEDGS